MLLFMVWFWSIAIGWWVLVFGVGKGSKGGNEFGVTLARNGNHLEHELAFFNTKWPTTSIVEFCPWWNGCCLGGVLVDVPYLLLVVSTIFFSWPVGLEYS